MRMVETMGSNDDKGTTERHAANTDRLFATGSSATKGSPHTRSIRRHLLAGFTLVGVVFVGFGGWAATAPLAGAVVASGRIVVAGELKRIQHRTGGIVGQILVQNGDVVQAGDLLVRLDATLTKANLAIVDSQMTELIARRMRLAAERDGAGEPVVPRELAARRNEPAVASAVTAELALFVARGRMMTGQKRQLQERVGQVQQERDGLTARRTAKDDELNLVAQELQGIETLHRKGLTPFSQVAALKRAQAQLAGDRGQLTADIARAGTRISETELQILQLDKQQLSDVLTELREVEGKLAELQERRVAAVDELNRVDIRAPRSGIVHELAVHTIGGVIAPGDTIMSLVPDDERLMVDAKLQPADIDQIHPGQAAVLRFSAFNQRTTPEVDGLVYQVSADLTEDPASRTTWYDARIEIPASELERMKRFPLVPGMPVEAFIQTGERTAMSYLLKPLSDQFSRAMKEQ